MATAPQHFSQKTKADQSKMAVGKRKRSAANKISPEEQYNIERADRYRTLLKFCEKQIRKEGKAVKTFETQKIVKRLKLLGGDGGGTGNSSDDKGGAGATGISDKMKKAQEKRRRQAERLEQKLLLTKAYDVDRLVALCSKRIGLGNLAPPPSEDVEDQPTGDDAVIDRKSSIGEESGSKEELSEEDEAMLSQLTEDMLKHKRLVDVVEKLNDRITDHRRWVMRREDHLFGSGFPGQDDAIPTGGGKKRKGNKKGSGKADNDARADHAGPAALFIGSLSGAGMDDGDDEDREGYGDYYGPGGHEDEYGLPIKKKNRPGQRQRKAKAMAIEAKKAGKTWDSSSNWRETKKSKDDDGSKRRGNKANSGDGGSQWAGNEQKISASGLKTGDKVVASDVATMGKDWKEAGKAHPSWAAQQAQKAKSGIQQFAGKKITFD